MRVSDSETPRSFEELTVGRQATTTLLISASDMKAFAELSGDRSPVHHDAEFARRCGFSGPVVYGGLMIAALSRMVGMILPGPIGVATGWRIDFHAPLYVAEPALLTAEVAQVSESVRLAKLRFTIAAGERLIAKGTAEAKIVA